MLARERKAAADRRRRIRNTHLHPKTTMAVAFSGASECANIGRLAILGDEREAFDTVGWRRKLGTIEAACAFSLHCLQISPRNMTVAHVTIEDVREALKVEGALEGRDGGACVTKGHLVRTKMTKSGNMDRRKEESTESVEAQSSECVLILSGYELCFATVLLVTKARIRGRDLDEDEPLFSFAKGTPRSVMKGSTKLLHKHCRRHGAQHSLGSLVDTQGARAAAESSMHQMLGLCCFGPLVDGKVSPSLSLSLSLFFFFLMMCFFFFFKCHSHVSIQPSLLLMTH